MERAKNNILARLRQSNAVAADHSLPSSPLKSAKSNENETDLVALFKAQCQTNKIALFDLQTCGLEIIAQLAKDKALAHWMLGTQFPMQQEIETLLNQHQLRVTKYDARYENLKSTLFDDIDASITSAAKAIAETGTLVLLPSTNEPRMMSLIPPVHIVLLERQNILASMQEYIAEMPSPMPTNLLFISSPSKTADIQQTLAYGAHGPKELIVLLS